MEEENGKKIFIFEKPIVTTQKFEISFVRKQIDRQSFNTACDVADSRVDYEIYREVDGVIR